MALSVLLLMGMGFGVAFVTDFTVENHTGGNIAVTPVGTIGKEGRKAPLPVKMLLVLPAIHAGGFRLGPGEAITIRYDMDDINFSEIVVDDDKGQHLQLITDPNPTTKQYHRPLQRLYVIDDLAQLNVVTPAVARAAQASHGQWSLAAWEMSILFGPWLIFSALKLALRRFERRPVAA